MILWNIEFNYYIIFDYFYSDGFNLDIITISHKIFNIFVLLFLNSYFYRDSIVFINNFLLKKYENYIKKYKTIITNIFNNIIKLLFLAYYIYKYIQLIYII